MRAEAAPDTDPHGSPGVRGAVVALFGGAAAMALAAGGLLWWRYGGTVFNDMVAAGLAWCS